MTEQLQNLIICKACSSKLTDPLSLPCGHTFCKSCLTSLNKAGKLECPSCKKEHKVANGDLDKSFKKSELALLWVKLHSKHFDNIDESDDEDNESEGLCPICTPQPKKAPPKKDNKVGDESHETHVEPIKVKLAKCYHCDKQICESCRSKHYTQLKQENLKNLDNYHIGAGNITVVAEKINESREKKVLEYEKLKLDVTARKAELEKKLIDEEKNLHKKIDDEISLENKKLTSFEDDRTRLIASRESLKYLKEKLNSEKHPKRIVELCKSISKTEAELQNMLLTEKSRNDPSKEKKNVFVPTKLKEEIIGKIEIKSDDLKVKQANVPSESKVCTIL